MFKVCINTGGTFTDCVVLDDKGRKKEFKSPSTPADFSIGVVDAINEAASAFSLSKEQFLEQTELIMHGTTAATNALVTKNVAHTALIGTKGFRDINEIRRSLKIETHSMYEAFIPPYQPIVPRYLRDPQEVLKDVKNELVSIQMAKDVYKVIIDPEKMQVL